MILSGQDKGRGPEMGQLLVCTSFFLGHSPFGVGHAFGDNAHTSAEKAWATWVLGQKWSIFGGKNGG